MQPFHFPRTSRTVSAEFTIPRAVKALAVAEVGAWVTDERDERAWTSHGRIAMQRAQVRLFDALVAGEVSAYVRAFGQREVDADFWRVGNPHAVQPLPFVFTVEPIEPELRLPERTCGQGVPEDAEGASILLAADDLASVMPSAPARAAGPSLSPEARTGDPGRPTLGRELYMSEHARRIASGDAVKDLKAEAEELRAWFQRSYPGCKISGIGNIQNNIRILHRKHFPIL